ncbi:MAG: hypothetical protein PWQ27_1550 [Kosmotoga sp.]|nr:hypothetical protein [Kosmotoga sp.]
MWYGNFVLGKFIERKSGFGKNQCGMETLADMATPWNAAKVWKEPMWYGNFFGSIWEGYPEYVWKEPMWYGNEGLNQDEMKELWFGKNQCGMETRPRLPYSTLEFKFGKNQCGMETLINFLLTSRKALFGKNQCGMETTSYLLIELIEFYVWKEPMWYGNSTSFANFSSNSLSLERTNVVWKRFYLVRILQRVVLFGKNQCGMETHYCRRNRAFLRSFGKNQCGMETALRESNHFLIYNQVWKEPMWYGNEILLLHFLPFLGLERTNVVWKQIPGDQVAVAILFVWKEPMWYGNILVALKSFSSASFGKNQCGMETPSTRWRGMHCSLFGKNQCGMETHLRKRPCYHLQ